MHVCDKSLQSYLTVCNPMDCSPPGFPVHRILQTRLLEWIAMLSSRESSQSRNRALISYLSCLTDSFATISATSVQFSSVTQSCLTLCDPVDCSPPGFPVHGILQATILEWVAMPSSRGSPQPRDQTPVSYVCCIDRQFLYHWHHPGSP